MVEILCPIAQAAQEMPDQIAVSSPATSLSYAELNRAVHRLGTYLQKLGVAKETRVTFIAKPTLQTVVLFFALLRLQAIVCPLSFRYPEEQLKAAIEQLAPFHWIEPSELPIDAASACPLINTTLNTDQIATWLFTSGSSARPKIACHTVGNHYYNSLGVQQALGIKESSSWLLSLPLFHVSGISVLFRCLMKRAKIVITDLPLSKALQAVTHISVVPTQLFRLLQEPFIFPKHLECMLVGGAPLSDSLYQQALSLGLPILSTYGMTEMGSIIALQNLTLLPFREVKIASDGEIWVRGETLFKGYWNHREAAYAAPFKEGWFPTKDLGLIDEKGMLKVIGRKDRQFISGGENIQPEEIERALCQLTGILSAFVSSISDTEFGNRPVAYILEETPQHTLESIRKGLAEFLPAFKFPVQVLPFTQEMLNGFKPQKTSE